MYDDAQATSQCMGYNHVAFLSRNLHISNPDCMYHSLCPGKCLKSHFM